MSVFKIIVCAAALFTCTELAHAAQTGESRKGTGFSVHSGEGDGPERIGARQQVAPRSPYLLSTNRWTEMMLKDEAVYLQMTDYGIKQIQEPQERREKDEGFFGNVIKAMALSGVKQLLDHSLALSLSDIRSAQARDGEVVFLTCQGKEVFNKVKINGEVQKFPVDQAEKFADTVNRRRAALPACRP